MQLPSKSQVSPASHPGSQNGLLRSMSTQSPSSAICSSTFSGTTPSATVPENALYVGSYPAMKPPTWTSSAQLPASSTSPPVELESPELSEASPVLPSDEVA